MKVKELIKTLASLDGEAEVFVTDLIGGLANVYYVDDGYLSDGFVGLAILHYFPDEWFDFSDEGTIEIEYS